MLKSVKYDPNDPGYKNPPGAAEVNALTRFKICFFRSNEHTEVFLSLTKDGEQRVDYRMDETGTDDKGAAEYSAEITVTSRGLYFYRFMIKAGGTEFWVGRGPDQKAVPGGADWQLTVYDKAESRPKWLEGGVIYQIMPDRFFTGGTRLKTKTGVNYRDDWGGLPQYMPDDSGKVLNNDMFGGNLKGIIKKLPYLKSLNITAIYLNPIFEARSNHKYDTGNYRKIDPDFGSLSDFTELILKAKKAGIKIILDGVFSHTGDDSIYFNKYGRYDSVGAYSGPDSPYFEWYRFSDFGKKKYDCWWGIETLPNTDEINKYYDEFINGEDGIINYWTSLGIGGWRLDVADELPDAFLDHLVKTAKKADKDAVIIGEVWEDASNKTAYSVRRRYLQGGQLDSVTNYPFKEAIINFIKTGNEKGLYDTVNSVKNNYPKHILDCLMNVLGSHDTLRILTVFSGEEFNSKDERSRAVIKNGEAAVKKVKMAAALQFTLPGVPCVYYGDETGMQGYEDPFNRRCYPWTAQNNALLKFYKRLSSLRAREKDIFKDGEFIPLYLEEDGIFAFERSIKNRQKIVVIVNNGAKDFMFEKGCSYINLLTLKPFYGIVESGSVCIFKVSPAS